MSNFTRWDLMKITAIKKLWSKYESEVLLLAPWSPSWPNLRCPPTLSYEPTQFHSLGSLAPFHSIGGATRFISSAQLSPSKQGLWYYIVIFFDQTISCCSILVSFGENLTLKWFCWFSQEKPLYARVLYFSRISCWNRYLRWAKKFLSGPSSFHKGFNVVRGRTAFVPTLELW